MKYRSFLIKYAEIGVKGKNRYLFEDALVKQIHHRLKNLEGNFSVTKEAGRIYAEAAEDFDYDEVIDARAPTSRAWNSGWRKWHVSVELISSTTPKRRTSIRVGMPCKA